MKRTNVKSGGKKPPLIELLLHKYRADPQGFCKYLPEVAQELDAMFPHSHPSRSPFGLTEHEHAHRQQALSQVLSRLDDATLTSEEAVRGLEHCATLIEDDSLPREATHEILSRMVRAVIGKSPGSVKKSTTVPIGESQKRKEEALKHVSLVRGVLLDLTRDMRLVSVSINPHKIRERRKVLRLVGIASDSGHDVAQRHDDYLAETGPHAAT
ncbi:MAG: hypothetical protein ABID84_02925 [Chloroflexota bacterium]